MLASGVVELAPGFLELMGGGGELLVEMEQPGFFVLGSIRGGEG